MNSLLERIREEEKRMKRERLSIVYGIPISEIIQKEQEDKRQKELEEIVRKITRIICYEITPHIADRIKEELKETIAHILGTNAANLINLSQGKMSKNEIEKVISKIPLDNIEAMVDLFVKKMEK